jgi:hypothetical protein
MAGSALTAWSAVTPAVLSGKATEKRTPSQGEVAVLFLTCQQYSFE